MKLFFAQKRIGYQNKVFLMYKFRTMNDKKDEKGNLLPDMQRITFFGKFLRKFSLDELPQFWNILKGEMALVGPRPLPIEYLALLSEKQKKRHQVKPGITGWSQVNGRNQLSWEEKFKLDLWYVENKSFALDFLILWKTLFVLFKTKEVNFDKNTTMPIFKGNEK